MNIVLISRSEGDASNRVKKIADRFAVRSGDNAWCTSITEESLSDLKSALRRTASKNTAVACYRNHGTRKMSLLWTVGCRNRFGLHGESPIAWRSAKAGSTDSLFPSDIMRLASIEGRLHDIGKASNLFQDKLHDAIFGKNYGDRAGDDMRHELISALIVSRMLDGASWDEAWSKGGLSISKNDCLVGGEEQKKTLLWSHITSARDAAITGVMTHHLMDKKAEANRYMRGGHADDGFSADFQLSGRGDHADIRKIAEKAVAGLIELDGKGKSPEYWFGVSWFARMALIMADQHISSDPEIYQGDHAGVLFANSATGNKKASYRQTLKYHLSKVGSEAGSIAREMTRLVLPTIDADVTNRILEPSSGRFEWQNHALDSLTQGRQTLVLNVASTGSGKTRMNIKALTALSGQTSLRASIVMGLRTLTLQTGDSMREDFGMTADQLAVVIGSRAAQIMHDYDDVPEEVVLEMEPEMDVLEYDDASLAPAIRTALKGSKKLATLIQTPILVSTIDYLIKAGEPAEQRLHAVAMLRVMHSDLIIDEIDGFDPGAMGAVLRLIKTAAMCGRNVVASSATLPPVVVGRVVAAFQEGVKIWRAMSNNGSETSKFDVAVISDKHKPVFLTTNGENFKAVIETAEMEYGSYIAAMLDNAPRGTKMGEIIRCEKTKDGIMAAIATSCEVMHERHKWADVPLSLGLVRISNIKNAIPVARMLAKLPDTLVCCYHARRFAIQRCYIERELRSILTRKKDPMVAAHHPEIARALAEGRDVRVIVVATSIEEVGQDHDFDWAVIEAASAQSIVQTGGRVNRHRLVLVTTPNIALLQFNFNSVAGGKGKFSGLSLENGESHERLQDMLDLIDESNFVNFDAGIRFHEDVHALARFDSDSIRKIFKRTTDHVIQGEMDYVLAGDTYTEDALRKQDSGYTFEVCRNPEGVWIESRYDKKTRKIVTSKIGGISDDEEEVKNNILFGMELNTLAELASGMGLSHQDAFSVDLKRFKDGRGFFKALRCRLSDFGMEMI